MSMHEFIFNGQLPSLKLYLLDEMQFTTGVLAPCSILITALDNGVFATVSEPAGTFHVIFNDTGLTKINGDFILKPLI